MFTSLALAGANSAMKMFQKRDELGTSDMSTKLNTTHQNQVSEVGVLLSFSNRSRNSKKLFRCATSLVTRHRQGLFPLSQETENLFSGILLHSRWRVSRFNLLELTSLTDGHQYLVQISYILDFLVQNGGKVVMTLSIDFLLIQFPTFINYILLLIW